jgi:ketosteroid isomerase-like protein
MSHHRPISSALIAFFLLGSASAATANAAEPSPRDEIKAALDAQYAAILGGISAAKFAEMLYTPDVVIVGEGDTGLKHGIHTAISELEAHWASLGPDGVKKCRVSLAEGPAVHSAKTYASFAVLHCEPNPPAVKEAGDFRVLYVWKKLPQGWRVALEQWGIGKL